jgi:glycosyltransferase involved in cell wall biosynthesis
MRIAYIITRADAVGGASIHVRDLASHMMRRGHEVIALVGGKGPVTVQFASVGVTFHSLQHLQRAIHPWRDYLGYRELLHVLKAWKPDIVSTHTAKAGLLGRAACRSLRIPVTYTPHGWSIGQRISAVAGPIFCMVERMAARWTDAIICVSEQERQLALKKHVAAPEKLRVIHNGMRDIDPKFLANPAIEPVRICSVARFEAPKDHSTLLHALATLKSLTWKLDLIGDGPEHESMQQLASLLKIDDRVTFHGYQQDPAAILSRAQLFVLSTRSEAFPRSILEAMRAGLPIVASNVGGVSEAILHGENGLLVPPSSPDALAGALRAVILDSSLRQHFGASARRDYEERFRLDRMVDDTAAVYDAVLGNYGVESGKASQRTC